MDASNNVWDVPEGRPIWKKIPVRLGVTVVLLVLLTVTALAVVFTGPVAQKAGDIIGLGARSWTSGASPSGPSCC